MVAQQELQHHGRRELRRAAESAARGVVLPRQSEQRLRELLGTGGSGLPVVELPPREVPYDPLRDLGHLLGPPHPRGAHAFEHLHEGGHPVPGLGREVGPEVEGLGVGGQEHRHGPPALPGGGLHGLHVDGVDVGALFAVDLDVDEVFVHVGGDEFVFEALGREDMTPMTRRVTNAEQYGHAPLPRLREGLRGPGPPVDGIVGMLEQVRGGLVRKAIRHAAYPAPRACLASQTGAGVRARAGPWRRSGFGRQPRWRGPGCGRGCGCGCRRWGSVRLPDQVSRCHRTVS